MLRINLSVLLAALVLVACKSTGARPNAEPSIMGHTIRFSELESPPMFAGLSDTEILNHIETQKRLQNSSTDTAPAFLKTTLAEALDGLKELWYPTHVPETFPKELAIVLSRDVEQLLTGDTTFDHPLPRVLFAGYGGSILTITPSKLPANAAGDPFLNIPVGEGSTSHVVVDGASEAVLIHGHWLIRLNEDRTEVEQVWDRDGAKRLLFVRGEMLFEVDVAPASALTDRQLIEIGASILPSSQ